MTTNTIIFDLDGTISDPFEGISRSVNYALEACGYEAASADRIRCMIGPPLTEIFEFLIGSLPEARMLELVDKYRERYAHTGYRENVIYAGIPDTVAELAKRGFKLGVCTSKRADYAAKIIDMFGLAGYFEFVDGGDVHVKKYQQLERLVANGIDASSAVMIGDRAVDIEAAATNSMRSVGVRWGFAESDELENARPDEIVASPGQLLELFS